jgi:hypothetical protein
MKIDTSNWQEFIFKDIFDIKKGFYNKKPEHTIDGNIPFLGATEKNNGVTEYYSIIDIENSSKNGDDNNSPLENKIFPSNSLCITNNGSVGYAFFQKEAFTCSHDVNPLYIIDGEFNEYTALFIATVIEKDRYRWAYGRKWRPERMVDSKILLPSSQNNKPDWEFMEDYIKTLRHKKLKTTIKKNYNRNIEETKYKEFCIGDIFDVIYGVNLELNSCEETSANDPEAVNFVSRSKENNGITAYIKPIPNLPPQNAGLITVAGGGSSVLSTFVQVKPFYSGRDLYLLDAKENISTYSKLYITTIIMANKYKYSFGRQANKTLAKLKIVLPCDSNLNPDYKYMEKYIKSLPFSDKINANII